ncbi:MAG: 5-formyltetrahydrofolate cyclo-ligase [Aerococcus sp.]|nr:5-formyltetrahydrofolate cyclo-ligase [Aerococcus sp.]
MLTIPQRKKNLRELIFTKRQQLCADYYQKANQKITKAILDTSEFNAAQTIFVFQSLPYEFDTATVIQIARKTGKQILLPVTDTMNDHLMLYPYPKNEEWHYGSYHIKEPLTTDRHPVSGEKVDLAILPCVTATHSGQRLGHGGGYYDRWLATYSPYTILPCFEQLIVPELPIEPHDYTANCVITELATYY